MCYIGALSCFAIFSLWIRELVIVLSLFMYACVRLCSANTSSRCHALVCDWGFYWPYPLAFFNQTCWF